MGLNLPELRKACADHGTVTRVLIVDHKGSTPRETGAAMLVWDNGQAGTIGGGALELQAITLARKATKPKALTIPLGPALGQCCGGSLTLVIEPFSMDTIPNETTPFLRQITGVAEHPLTIRRTLKSTRNSGAQTPLIWQDGWLLEAIETAATPLWLYGAGHVGRAIVDTLAGLPFQVTWVDSSLDRFPNPIPAHATQLVATNPADAVKHAPATAHHLVLTYSHALDLDLCHAVLNQPHASLGLIGSKTKRTRFSKRLLNFGHTPQKIAQMICPIGQRSLGKTPKAIAIGVASQLLTHDVAQHGERKTI